MGQEAALFLQQLLGRHPALLRAVDKTVDMEQACRAILDGWITALGAADTNAKVVLQCGSSSGYGAARDGASTLGFDFPSDYSKRVYLKPLCERLERAVPGLAGQLILTLDAVDWSVAEIMTPQAIFAMYSDYAWGGCGDDAGYAEYRADMGDDDEEFTGFKPSDFWACLGPKYQEWVGRADPTRAIKLWSYKRLTEEASSAPAWVAEVMRMLVRLRKLHKKVPHVAGLKDKFSHPDIGSKWCLEPKFTFWWTEEEDDLGDLWEDVFQYRYQCSDDYTDLIFEDLMLTDESAVELIDWIEGAVPFLTQLEQLRLFLWSNQNEQRRRVRRRK